MSTVIFGTITGANCLTGFKTEFNMPKNDIFLFNLMRQLGLTGSEKIFLCIFWFSSLSGALETSTSGDGMLEWIHTRKLKTFSL